MRLGNVKAYGRFVFDDRGGVWKRTEWKKARCIYGREYGIEIDVDPNVSVYAIFDTPRRIQRDSNRDVEEGTESKGGVDERPTEPPPEPPRGQNPDTVACPKCGNIGRPGACPTCNATPIAPSREIVESPEDEGAVVKEEGMPEPTKASAKEGMKIVMLDDDEKVLREVSDCTAAQVVAMTCSDGIKLNVSGRTAVEMTRDESYYDVEKNALYIMLRD